MYFKHNTYVMYKYLTLTNFSEGYYFEILLYILLYVVLLKSNLISIEPC